MGDCYRETPSHATGNATVPRTPRLHWIAAITAIALSAGLLGACGGGPELPKTLTEVVAMNHDKLSEAQKASVTAAAREITGDGSASVYGLTLLKKPGAPGTHVCGYVKTAANSSTPLYIELQEAGEGVVAERGQIGATPANLAKVNFMCRSHKNW